MDTTANSSKPLQRRPIASRNTAWAARIAVWLASRGATPNGISLTSIVMAALAGTCILLPTFVLDGRWRWMCFPVAAGFIVLRLLCNLFDGMVAVEGNQKSPAGDIYNDLPDRVSDTIILIAAGYAAARGFPHTVALGYLATILAMATAYIRLLGASMGLGHCFSGPMAKQQRMAVIIVALLAEPVVTIFAHPDIVLGCALCLISLGALFTCLRRLMWIFRQLPKT